MVNYGYPLYVVVKEKVPKMAKKMTHPILGQISKRPDIRLVQTLKIFLPTRENVIDELVISLPLKSQYKSASRVAFMAQEQGIMVRYLPNEYLRPEDIQNEKSISYNGSF